jgi:membrane protein
MEGTKINRKEFVEIAKSGFRKWLAHNASLRAAALAFFIILPLPSLLLILLAILAQIYGQTEALQALIQQVTAIAGPAVANLTQQVLEAVKTPFTSVFASFTTVVFTIIGAIGAFGVLHDTMNQIWNVTEPKKLGFIERIKHKIVPFLLVSSLGFAIMIWTGITTVLLSLITFALGPLASSTTSAVLRVAQIGLSFALATLLFAVMYKQIPDAPIQWRDVRLAAIITGLVFTVTNYLIGIFIEVFTITSVTGAAGSLMILLLWVFLILQFILYGAAFSKAYAEYSALKSSREKLEK